MSEKTLFDGLDQVTDKEIDKMFGESSLFSSAKKGHAVRDYATRYLYAVNNNHEKRVADHKMSLIFYNAYKSLNNEEPVDNFDGILKLEVYHVRNHVEMYLLNCDDDLIIAGSTDDGLFKLALYSAFMHVADKI